MRVASETTVVPIPWWAWAGLLGFAALGLAEHVLVKSGRFRAPLRWHFDERQPFYIRNLPFGALPFGLMFACWIVMAVVSRFQGQLWADFLVLPIGMFSFVLFGWGIKRQLRPVGAENRVTLCDLRVFVDEPTGGRPASQLQHARSGC